MARVAIVLSGVTSEHVGGAERFFSDFYEIYNKQPQQKHSVFFMTDTTTFQILNKKLSKLNNPSKLIFIPLFHNRFKNALEAIAFITKIIKHRINILHVGSYGKHYYHLLKALRYLPSVWRPKLVINIVDCEVPYVLNDTASPKYNGYYAKYAPLFKTIHIDAIYSWYLLFGEFMKTSCLFNGKKPYFEAVNTRFSDTERFVPAPEKKNLIIYAARLTDQKKPLFFLSAIELLKQMNLPELNDWKFVIYGNGQLEEKVKTFINDNEIGHLVEHHSSTDLAQVFAQTSCFVSTQDFENFPSLSMCEAMAAGNAVIARNVGQTGYFVLDSVNGFLLKQDTPEDLADTIVKYIRTSSAKRKEMQDESIRLTKKVHTAGNFILQIDAFWTNVLNLK